MSRAGDPHDPERHASAAAARDPRDASWDVLDRVDVIPAPVALEREVDRERGVTAPHPLRPRAWVLHVLAVAGLFVLTVMAFNWWVDPEREYRSRNQHTRADAAEKLDLIAAWDAPPDVLVLGSSTVMKFDPRDVRRITGKRAFNAGLTGARPSVAWALTSWIHEQHPNEPPPQLVIGLNNFAFHSGNDRWLRQEPRMRRQLPTPPLTERLGRWAALASLPKARDSVRALRMRANRRPGERVPGVVEAGARRVDDDGFLLRRYPTRPAVVRQRTANATGRYRRVVEQWDAEGGAMEAAQAAHFERLVRLANRRGGRPIVIITPINPVTWTELADTPFARQQRRVVAYLESLRPELQFTLVDAAHGDAFGVHEADFFDASHYSAEAAARLLERAFAQHERELGGS